MSKYSLVDNTTGEVVLETDARRLRSLQATSASANQRDRAVRYGTDKQPPYGAVKPSTYKKHPQTIRQAARRLTSYISRRLGIRKRPHHVVIRSVPAPVRPMRHTSRRRAQVREGYWPAFCDLVAILFVFALFVVIFWLDRGMLGGW